MIDNASFLGVFSNVFTTDVFAVFMKNITAIFIKKNAQNQFS